MDYEYFNMMKNSKSFSSVNNNTNKYFSDVFPASLPIAMAYVPYQKWKETYDADTALKVGTLFPELNLPLSGEEV